MTTKAKRRRRLRKLLVANRGEIALRIIRTAKTCGLKTVAVFSEADAQAAHVALADEAFLIGPPEPAQSYLNVEAIIATARRCGADAIHPGYGFLSERPDFARAVLDSGLIFVGPPAEVMAKLGDKLAARALAAGLELPVLPGLATAEAGSARAFAARTGFPVLVKAAAGGGGSGMRLVETEPELGAALSDAARQARTAFGDARVFLEKYLARARHVEVQVLGDERGKVVALGERECSIQRRYQKLVEESPAPGLDDSMRARMTEAALRLAAAVGYRSAGTVEFLVQGDKFYFLEVNARLQVEHPVTEMRFGIDLVAEQLRLAAGEPATDSPAPRGHALECRIYAEEPERDFRPATGRVLYLNLPAGAGVRVDTDLTMGSAVLGYYDGLLAKLVCWGLTREQARQRALNALSEFALLGVHHTAAFLRDVITSAPFRRAELSTRFIPQFFARWHPCDEACEAALIGAVLAARGEFGAGAAPERRGAWVGGRGVDDSRSPWARLNGFEVFGTDETATRR